MKAQRGISLSAEDVDTTYGALIFYTTQLEQHRSWLCTTEGNPLPGTEIVIDEIGKEIIRFKELTVRVYNECFVGIRRSTQPKE